VIKVEGIGGLYRGMGSTLMTLFAANFIYFYAFHILRIGFTRSKASRDLGKKLGISRAFFNLTLGTLAGAINVAFVQPLWVANARLKLQGTEGHGKARYRGVADVLSTVYKEEVSTERCCAASCVSGSVLSTPESQDRLLLTHHPHRVCQSSGQASLQAFFCVLILQFSLLSMKQSKSSF